MMPYEAVKWVANEYQVTDRELKGKGRTGYLARARQILYYILYKKCGKSATEIGKMLGDRDHTTIMYGVKKIAGMVRDGRITLPANPTIDLSGVYELRTAIEDGSRMALSRLNAYLENNYMDAILDINILLKKRGY